MTKARITRAQDNAGEEHPWGRLNWFVSGALGNSDTLTVGRCQIEPGQANQPHYHPNCDEVLHVLHGKIRHRLGDEYFEMAEGDTISIPTGQVHNAQNIGADRAVLLITFSTADRQVVGAE
ncbi:cupin domain-containing protein [Actinopolymorpha alba]|uniref:cupin domain-containing protein n=1 Tax=Actinopolymorpha alba TaxID=533267 RepID=UPI000367467D|nr:cupin domain-containing protein [Actinopolymorpha alba]